MTEAAVQTQALRRRSTTRESPRANPHAPVDSFAGSGGRRAGRDRAENCGTPAANCAEPAPAPESAGLTFQAEVEFGPNARRICVALQALQIAAKFGGGLIAEVWIFFERLSNDFFELRRKIGIQ